MKKLLPFCILVLLFAACKKNNTPPSPDIISFTPEKGAPGIKVYITGLHFDSVAANVTVSFNGATTTAYTANDSQVVVIVPKGATTGKISVTVKGRTGTSVDDFTLLTSGSWQKLADVPTLAGNPVGRGLGVGFAINNKGYIGMGTANGGDYSDMYEYDPGTNAWTKKSPLGFGLEGAVCMVLNNKAYIGISQSSQLSSLSTKQLWAYDPLVDNWTKKADFPGADTREGLGIAIGNMGYVGFGLTGTSKSWWQYDPAADQWTQKNDFPGTSILSWAVGFTLNNKGYIIGQPGASSTYQCWQYDPATDKWTQKNNYPGSPFILATAITVGSKGFVMGGGQECWEYDDTTDTWTQKVFFGTRIGGSGFALGNFGYFGTGSNDGYYADFWQFAP